MDNTEEKNEQPCTPDEACCCDTAASTKEEINAALDNLIDLIKRYDGCAIFSAFFEDTEEKLAVYSKPPMPFFSPRE